MRYSIACAVALTSPSVIDADVEPVAARTNSDSRPSEPAVPAASKSTPTASANAGKCTSMGAALCSVTTAAPEELRARAKMRDTARRTSGRVA